MTAEPGWVELSRETTGATACAMMMAPMAAKRDYYEVLGVPRNASEHDIASSFRKLAIQYHPDSNPGDEEATERFKEAAEAYEVLSDKEKRSRYDRFGHAGVDGVGAGTPHFTDVEDIFDAFGDLFGGSVFGDFFGGGRHRTRRRRRGADVKVEVTLDLAEAARGVTKTVGFQRSTTCQLCHGTGSRPGSTPQPCSHCNGHGQVVQVQAGGILRVQTTCPRCQGSGHVITDPCSRCRGRGLEGKPVRLDIPIPAGVDNGTRMKVTGEGHPSHEGGPPGDCYCFIRVREHSLFEREGPNLFIRMPITYTQAVLGANIDVPTLDGRDQLKIPPGTDSGHVFRLRRRGMPDPHGGPTGDLLVRTFVDVPKKLAPGQEELLRELAVLDKTHVSPQRKSFLETLREYFTGTESSDPNTKE
jgi:molecular chaperone DnaJ